MVLVGRVVARTFSSSFPYTLHSSFLNSHSSSLQPLDTRLRPLSTSTPAPLQLSAVLLSPPSRC